MAFERPLTQLNTSIGVEPLFHVILYALHLGFWWAAGSIIDFVRKKWMKRGTRSSHSKK
ncbi:hypothetical protein [Paenibacillus turpanensis]|uniref:hypothetical protein n=1 Tax=Paenibacillus turpanensis TaxID=2689078 RepID=UPI00140D3AE0|nr:hypothetical protein [Paenibacillus turpanensis]